MGSKRKRPQKPVGKTLLLAASRNGFLDSLRGFAIVLMVIDHAADLIFHTPIDYSTIRFGTRLSMPLFAVLMGYFLQDRIEHRTGDQTSAMPRQSPIKRLLQILVAALATNLLYFSKYGVFDILADLAICYAIFLFTKNKFVFCYLALFLYPYDSTTQIFDYPLTIVLCLVAQGAVLRRFGMERAVACAIVLTIVAVALVTKPSLLAVLFALPATLLVGWAAQSKGMVHPWLTILGRYPLTAYVAQYYVLFGIAKFIAAIQS